MKKILYLFLNSLCFGLILFANVANAIAGCEIKIISPVEGQQGLSNHPEIVIQSVDPIDPSSVVTVSDDPTKQIPPTVLVVTESDANKFYDRNKIKLSAEGDYSLSLDKKTLTFRPGGLNFNTTYEIFVSGLKGVDPSGNTYNLPAITGMFSTSYLPIKFVEMSPHYGTAVAPSDIVSVTFDKELQSVSSLSGELVSIKKIDVSDDSKTVIETPITMSLLLSADKKTIQGTAMGLLERGKTYEATVHLSYITGDERDDYKSLFFTESGYSLAIAAEPPEAVRSTQDLVNAYPFGKEANIFAPAPQLSYRFKEWIIETPGGSNQQIQDQIINLKIDSRAQIPHLTAVYEKRNEITITAATLNNNGSVKILDLNRNEYPHDSNVYKVYEGIGVFVEAFPKQGYQFDRWEAGNQQSITGISNLVIYQTSSSDIIVGHFSEEEKATIHEPDKIQDQQFITGCMIGRAFMEDGTVAEQYFDWHAGGTDYTNSSCEVTLTTIIDKTGTIVIPAGVKGGCLLPNWKITRIMCSMGNKDEWNTPRPPSAVIQHTHDIKQTATYVDEVRYFLTRPVNDFKVEKIVYQNVRTGSADMKKSIPQDGIVVEDVQVNRSKGAEFKIYFTKKVKTLPLLYPDGAHINPASVAIQVAGFTYNPVAQKLIPGTTLFTLNDCNARWEDDGKTLVVDLTHNLGGSSLLGTPCSVVDMVASNSFCTITINSPLIVSEELDILPPLSAGPYFFQTEGTKFKVYMTNIHISDDTDAGDGEIEVYTVADRFVPNAQHPNHVDGWQIWGPYSIGSGNDRGMSNKEIISTMFNATDLLEIGFFVMDDDEGCNSACDVNGFCCCDAWCHRYDVITKVYNDINALANPTPPSDIKDRLRSHAYDYEDDDWETVGLGEVSLTFLQLAGYALSQQAIPVVMDKSILYFKVDQVLQ